MKYDLMLIGPATRDVNIDYTGKEVHEIGGAVFFCSAAAKAAGANLFASVKIHPDDTDIIDAFKLDSDHVAILPSETTTLMQNTYFTADRERRKAECLAQSGPITPDQIPEVDCGLYHLAGLLYGDFPNELIVELKKRGKVSADIQGFLRHNEGGLMNFHDWSDKLEYLKYFDFLKTDAAEAEILTGLTDRREAAKQLYAWGAKEILISHNSEMLVYDGKDFFTCPVKARNLSVRLATTERLFDRQANEAKEHTEWHTITLWRGLADVVDRYVRKGTQIYVEGTCVPASGWTRTTTNVIRPRSWPT